MIYLDYQATTPLAPEAREAMLPWLDGPSTVRQPAQPHRLGRQAEAAVEVARERVAALLPPGGTVVFTSGRDRGAQPRAARVRAGRGGRRPDRHLRDRACRRCSTPRWPAPGPTPRSCRSTATAWSIRTCAAAAIDERIGIVAVMQVNNEIGTIQPVADLCRARAARGRAVRLRRGAGGGRVPIAEADMIAVSAHKFHGPKGIGALWVRDGVELEPLLHGGGQEGGLRSGTLSPGAVRGDGRGGAAGAERMDEDARHVDALWDARARAVRRLDGSTAAPTQR